MRFIVVLLFMAVAVCPISTLADSQSPVGDWSTDFRIAARDQGVCYLTFSNDFSCVGYGISEDSYGLFPILGSWFVDDKGHVVMALTLQLSSGGRVVSALGIVSKNDRFKAKGSTPDKRKVNFKGTPAATAPDLAGLWNTEVHTFDKRFFESYTVSASTNYPGVFDINGIGNGPQGAYTITGSVMATAQRRMAGVIISNYGSGPVMTAEVAGRLSGRLDRFKLRGWFFADSHRVTIRGERP